MKKNKVFVGTSCGNYQHWVNISFPQGIHKKDWL